MGCIKNLSKTLAEWTAIVLLGVLLLSPVDVWAAFASQFSLGVGEEYNDNIFFSKTKDHDFITRFIPTLSFYYAPFGQVAPAASLSITPTAEIFARRSELNNFGENLLVEGSYAYRYSPQLNFDFSDIVQRQGPTRTQGFGEPVQLQTGATTPGTGFPGSQDLRDFISRGDQITNSFSARGFYLYSPSIGLAGFYTNGFTKFIDEGGTDVYHEIGARGVYNWRQDHNLHAGYSVSIRNSRNGDTGVIHNFDIGDDYFTNYNIKLTPTLSLTASTGLSLNTGKDGPKVANNTNITVTKLWETATLNVGLRKGLTPSFGVSGISDTTSLFVNYSMRFTERLTTNANVNWSYYDTDDVNFKTLEAGVGLQYLITTWLSSALNYRFSGIDSGRGARQTDLLNQGTINSNSVFLVFTGRFDLWPNIGLSRSLTSPRSAPTLRTPFAVNVPTQPVIP